MKILPVKFGQAVAFAPVVRGENKLVVRNQGDAAEIEMIGSIGKNWWDSTGISEQEFRDALKSVPKGKQIKLLINSEGGSVQDGLGMYNAIKERSSDVTAVIHGYALSIASVIPLAAGKVISPKSAIWMIHKAWAYTQGNADDMRKQADMLETHDETLAAIYAEHTGKSTKDILAAMESETWIKGADAVAFGLADETDSDGGEGGDDEGAEASYRPLDPVFLKRCGNIPAEILNAISPAPKPQGNSNHKPPVKPGNSEDKNVNREQKIALLNSWGVKVATDVTDARIDELIAMGKTGALAAVSGGTSAATQAATQTQAQAQTQTATAATTQTQAAAQPDPRILAMERRFAVMRNSEIRAELEQRASEGRIPLNSIATVDAQGNVTGGWLALAVAADVPGMPNPVLAQVAALEARNPGIEPLYVEVGEPTAVADVDKAVTNLLKPSRALMQGRSMPMAREREELAIRAKQIAGILAQAFNKAGELTGPIRQAWDRRASGFSVQNANTMSADLLRQVILSTVMRAFRRKISTLKNFSTMFQSVPLEGSDYVKVPYYPLNQTASSEFTQNAGYTINANGATSSKSIFVGGIGDGVATSGSGRKYQSLKISAYEYSRQPWLRLAELVALQADQLALDVRADILGTHIKAANFGNAIWSGAAGAFDKSVFSNYLLNAAIKAFWPEGMRHAVLTPDFYTSLIGDPGLQRVNEAGTDETLRQAKLGSLLSFASVDYDAVLPIANFIRGGDGTVTAGADTNLAGFIAFPSAILIATAPIMPPPGVMRKLLSYELVADDQTDLALTYQYFGDEAASVDKEIIECTYGSGLGELAALKRFTTAGN